MHLKNRKILLFHDQIFKGYYWVCRMNRMIHKKKENDQILFTSGLTTKDADAGDFGTGISSFYEDWDIEQNHLLMLEKNGESGD
jgi:hypothetical protein